MYSAVWNSAHAYFRTCCSFTKYWTWNVTMAFEGHSMSQKQLCKLTDIIIHRTFCDMYTVTALPSCKFSRKHFCSGCRRGTVPATLKCWTVRQFRHDSYSNYSTGVVSLSLLRAVLLMLAELTKTSLFTSRFRVSTRWTKKWGHKLMAIVLSNLNRFT